MKALILLLVCLLGLNANAHPELPEMPEVNMAQYFKFERPYSCRFTGEYDGSALFLTGFAKERNSPDLLLNGACGSKPYFQGATAGNDQAMFYDLGEMPLKPEARIEAMVAMAYYANRVVASGDQVPAIKGHTYAVFTHKDEIRARFIFKVLDIEKDGPAKISYSVESYSRKLQARDSSPWISAPSVPGNFLPNFSN